MKTHNKEIALKIVGIILEAEHDYILTDFDRKEIFCEISKKYCLHCGADYVPCYCTRD